MEYLGTEVTVVDEMRWDGLGWMGWVGIEKWDLEGYLGRAYSCEALGNNRHWPL